MVCTFSKQKNYNWNNTFIGGGFGTEILNSGILKTFLGFVVSVWLGRLDFGSNKFISDLSKWESLFTCCSLGSSEDGLFDFSCTFDSSILLPKSLFKIFSNMLLCCYFTRFVLKGVSSFSHTDNTFDYKILNKTELTDTNGHIK